MTQWNGAMYAAMGETAVAELGKNLIKVSCLGTDYSPEALQGTSLTTRLVKRGTVVDLADVSGDYSAAVDTNGSEALTIQMTSHPVTGFSVSDVEATQIARNVMPGLLKSSIAIRVGDIANAIVNNVAAKLTVANFGNVISNVAAASFDSGEVANIWGVAAAAGMPLDGSSSIILNGAYTAALFSDATFASYASSQQDVLKSGSLKSAYGFNFYCLPSLVGGTNIVGAVTSGTGLVIAMRAVPSQFEGAYLNCQVLQDAASGAVMTYAAYLDIGKRKIIHQFDTMFGIAVGDASAVKLIGNASATK